MAVTELGYLGFQVSDAAAWQRLVTEILGFELVEPQAGGPIYRRLDERAHRVTLYPAKTDGLAYAGWEVADERALARMVETLRAAKVEVTPGTSAEAAERKVKAFAKFRDPNGFAVELYHGAARAAQPFTPSRPISAYKTGPLGLGHLVLRCAKPEASVAFYRDFLGFKLTDTAKITRGSATFLHCNPRHHSLAFTDAQPGMENQVSHFMVEATVMEDVGRAYELALAKNVPMWLSLGQHTNDRVLSFYMRSPSGWGVEYGHGGLEIDDTNWEVKHWTSGSYWGRKPAG